MAFQLLPGAHDDDDRFHHHSVITRAARIESDQRHMIRRVSTVTEDIWKMGFTFIETGSKNCAAGGVALNCVANGRLLREGPFENIWFSRRLATPGVGRCGTADMVSFARQLARGVAS
jgi:carbamoyltransferase